MGKPGRLANSAADFDVIDIRGIDERIECLVKLAIHTVNNNCVRHLQLNFFFTQGRTCTDWRSASVNFKGEKSET